MNSEPFDESAWRRLESHRSEIDGLDEQLLNILHRRLAVAKKIGEVKHSLNLEVVDPERERRVLERLSTRGRGPLGPETIRAVFSSIIAASRAVQEPPRVGFLGPEGTFSHEAALKFYGKAAVVIPLRDIEEVFDRVARSECGTGIVPLENSCHGPVRDTLDLFALHDLTIQGEVRLGIRHHLLSHVSDPESIGVLYSHPMALAQCNRWIRTHLPAVRTEAVASTAQAARLASADPAAAAVGSRLAGDLAGVPVLRREIQDRNDNATRFAVLGRAPLDREPGERDRTSILIGLEHRPGALLNAIAPLAKHDVNITRIDSRPRTDRAWEYLFFLDLDGHAGNEPLAGALSEMSRVCSMVKVLGSYSRGDEP